MDDTDSVSKSFYAADMLINKYNTDIKDKIDSQDQNQSKKQELLRQEAALRKERGEVGSQTNVY